MILTVQNTFAKCNIYVLCLKYSLYVAVIYFLILGQFKVLLRKLRAHPSQIAQISVPMVSRIERLQRIAGLVSDEALPYIATFTPKYYNGMV